MGVTAAGDHRPGQAEGRATSPWDAWEEVMGRGEEEYEVLGCLGR